LGTRQSWYKLLSNRAAAGQAVVAAGPALTVINSSTTPKRPTTTEDVDLVRLGVNFRLN
jgi:hypothetical protein